MDAWTPKQWDEFWTDPWKRDDRWALHRHVAALVAEFAGNKGISVCDLGCGSGALLDKLRNLRWVAAVGVDSSEVAVSMCRARGRTASLGTIEGTVMIGEFDVVVLMDVLNCVPDPAATLLAAVRATREGGMLVVTAPLHEHVDYPSELRTSEEWERVMTEFGISLLLVDTIKANGQPYVAIKGMVTHA